MKDHRKSWLFAAALGAALAGCTSERAAPAAEPPVAADDAPTPAQASAESAASTSADAAPAPEQERVADEASPTAERTEPAGPAGFDVASVPLPNADRESTRL